MRVVVITGCFCGVHLMCVVDVVISFIYCSFKSLKLIWCWFTVAAIMLGGFQSEVQINVFVQTVTIDTHTYLMRYRSRFLLATVVIIIKTMIYDPLQSQD